ncbi:GNAT family N-acetyltransferase [Pendulispora brunnea]|uniref:GNAT family N-acetyltransferase n=1 Tax=Pendulispora brunnea TaxID=2905690 RepID=A0ABZ2K3I0_9BACT
MRIFFRGNLAIHAHCTYIDRDARGIAATLTVVPPGGVRVSLPEMLKNGLASLLLAQGPSVLRRMHVLDRAFKEADTAVAPGPHWYLHMMAVRGDLRGRGLGSKLASACLQRIVDEDDTHDRHYPTTLATQLETNCVFYRRLGFVDAGARIMMGAAGAPYTTFLMHRPAKTNA